MKVTELASIFLMEKISEFQPLTSKIILASNILVVTSH